MSVLCFAALGLMVVGHCKEIYFPTVLQELDNGPQAAEFEARTLKIKQDDPKEVCSLLLGLKQVCVQVVFNPASRSHFTLSTP